MESIFPGLFFLSHFALIIPRVALAILFLFDAKQIWDTRKRRGFALALGVIGIFIGSGFLTQMAAISAVVLVVIAYSRMKEHSLFGNWPTLLLTLSTLLLLLVSGPGGFAFDLPY